MVLFSDELGAVTRSAQEVVFTDEIYKRLNNWGDIAAANAQYVRAFVFTYTSAGYVVVPKAISNTALPVIIYNRGGSKDFSLIRHGHLFSQIAVLARWGYIVIGSQYTGNSTSEGKDEWGGMDLQAVFDLYSIIQKISIADERRIGMFGVSRGGTMTYLALTKVKWIKAAVTIAGASDLARQSKLRPEMQEVFNDAFGGNEESKKQRSAICWPEKFPDNVPLLLMHGTADWRVSPLDSLDLAKDLYEHHKPF